MKLYRKKGLSEAEPWTLTTDMTNVSISEEDRQNGNPKPGGMIFRDPVNPIDRWYVSPEYFYANYEEA